MMMLIQYNTIQYNTLLLQSQTDRCESDIHNDADDVRRKLTEYTGAGLCLSARLSNVTVSLYTSRSTSVSG